MQAFIITIFIASAAMAESASTRLGGPNLDAELHHETM